MAWQWHWNNIIYRFIGLQVFVESNVGYLFAWGGGGGGGWGGVRLDLGCRDTSAYYFS